MPLSLVLFCHKTSALEKHKDLHYPWQ
ncbi:hypothetical protein NC652_000969 [Populus alba x Populus x berolinensis]|nr:hypothetical protein NC652_000969 [Populus alba x Populus x berolinensis]